MRGGRRDSQRPGCGSSLRPGRNLDSLPRGVESRGGTLPLFQPAQPQWLSDLHLQPFSVVRRPHLGSHIFISLFWAF